jgi:predicted nucleotidyltransferase
MKYDLDCLLTHITAKQPYISKAEDLFYYGFITGSRAFGTAHGKSDWDIVIRIKESKEIQEALTQAYPWDKIEPSYYFNGIKFCKGEFVLNLVIVRNDEDMSYWYDTTAFMCGNKPWLEVITKEGKYAMFGVILNSLRLAGVNAPWVRVRERGSQEQKGIQEGFVAAFRKAFSLPIGE